MNKETILLVEDEKDLVDVVRFNFQKEGYRVLAAGTAEAALRIFKKEHPSLMILDIMLPKMDGLELCRTIRQDSKVPIIFVSAKKDELDRTLGLRLGGDDYVSKPFSVLELIARVQAILRRTSPPPPEKDGAVRIGKLEVDFDRHEVKVRGRRIELTPREFDFLTLLIRADGKVLTRDSLLESVWGPDKPAEIYFRTVDQHIAGLRRKLKAERELIVTVKNRGYQLRKN
jgi:two-component system alkaline phosphatase synthesis response regulator PhoP